MDFQRIIKHEDLFTLGGHLPSIFRNVLFVDDTICHSISHKHAVSSLQDEWQEVKT
jgi:hypothetical protein